VPIRRRPDEARSARAASGESSEGSSGSSSRGSSRTAPPNAPLPTPNSPAHRAKDSTRRGSERPWRVSPAGTGGPHRTDVVLGLQARLTDRDEVLLGWLADHHVLTTPQITYALFGSTRFAQSRLLTLHRVGLIDRFRPLRPGGGAYPWHYVLAHLGALHVAAARDQSPQRPAATADRIRRIATSRTLDHRLGVNGFFTDLAGHARTHPGTRLDRWWSEAQCAAPGAFAPGLISPVRPDGHGVWTETGDQGKQRSVAFFLEYDTGAEAHHVLSLKLDRYAAHVGRGGPAWPILFVLHSRQREEHLQENLHGAYDGAIATATMERLSTSGPAQAVWTVPGLDHQPKPLIDLVG
jgi:Replication-relaxation